MKEKDEYGEKFTEHLLEEYKLYVQMTDNVSNRRAQANAFFISVLSALLLFLSLSGEGKPFGDVQDVTYIAVSLLSFLLCYIWHLNIQSYKQLNSAKFKVIHEIEQYLPYPCFDREWDFTGRGKDKKKYRPLTQVEQYVPLIMAIPFFVILVYSIFIALLG